MTPADSTSVVCVPNMLAIAPQTALPIARLAWTASRLMATARARTQAGAALCVPAPRLARVPTQAAPAKAEPSIASGVNWLAATSRTATIQIRTAAVTTLVSDRRCSWPGISSAEITAPVPNIANSSPKPPAPRPSWSRAMTGSSAHSALAQAPKARLRIRNERIATECRA